MVNRWAHALAESLLVLRVHGQKASQEKLQCFGHIMLEKVSRLLFLANARATAGYRFT
jgi:hypothetical protein